jgi:hypothetical protein
MNRIKQLDRQIDAWFENRWPGFIARATTLAAVLAGLALVMVVIYCTMKAKGLL